MAEEEITVVEDTEEDEGSEVVVEETVEQLKERIAKMDAQLKKANKQAEKLRLARVEEKPANKSDEEKAAKYKQSSLAVAARAELREAGFTGTKEQAARLTRLLDIKDFDIDEDGEVDGLEDAIAELKEDFPSLFTKVAVVEEKAKAPKLQTGDKKTGPATKYDSMKDPVAAKRWQDMHGAAKR